MILSHAPSTPQQTPPEIFAKLHRMKLGCNDSPPLRQLLDSGDADVDYLKVTSLTDLEPEISSALAYRPVLVHVGFGIGDSVATYADLNWDWFNAQLQRAGSPHIAMHVEVSTHNWATTTDLRFQTRDEARAMASHLTELCRVLRDRLEVPLLLENTTSRTFASPLTV